MQNPLHPEHHEPTRGEALSFFLKSRVFIARRWLREIGKRPSLHPRGTAFQDMPVAGEAKSPLWSQVSAAEFPLTAGKVQNLRVACARLDGTEVPAGGIFSFWKQLGRTTRVAGFTEGRELRSGCLVPNLGGGLCQLSGLLHHAALQAGLEVIEKHEHSRMLPGTVLEPERDATVFWNYVDLRFKASFPWRLEAKLTSTHLVVSICCDKGATAVPDSAVSPADGVPMRAAADGDCLTCGVTSCFRHPSAVHAHAPAGAHTVFLLEGLWPEFDTWCGLHSRPGDRWLTPLDGHRWKRPNYAWNPPPGAQIRHATWQTLRRSWRQRGCPPQGAVRQRFLLAAQRDLAHELARKVDPQARHLVVSQTLLPHLWLAGHLGGRTFDVLVNRWPLAALQAHLDEAAKRHPASGTLADFRADPALLRAEAEALAAAARIVTPHRAIAASFGARAILLDWNTPSDPQPRANLPETVRWLLPSSALGRKGIHELVAALEEVGGELLVLGRAREGTGDPLERISFRQASLEDLPHCAAVVMPAWIEHEPRIALRALACGIPVIASNVCGLPTHPGLTEIEPGDVDALKAAMRSHAAVCTASCAVA